MQLSASTDLRPLASGAQSGQPARVSLVPTLTTRMVEVDEYPIARRIVATAFEGEPFARGMYGDSPLARFAGLADDYAAWPSSSHPILIGVEAAGHLVGVALATLPDQCGLCDVFDQTKKTVVTNAERINDEFLLVSRRSHLTSKLPTHAHITTVATEPTLHGTGIGRLLMSALIDVLRSQAVETVVLECLTGRSTFYERCGFVRVDEFADPGGPNLRTLLMRADLPTST
jgi:GNAT superfamily N-acetyltransferase